MSGTVVLMVSVAINGHTCIRCEMSAVISMDSVHCGDRAGTGEPVTQHLSCHSDQRKLPWWTEV